MTETAAQAHDGRRGVAIAAPPSMGPRTDAQLMEAILAREEEALEELQRRHRNLVRSIAQRSTRDPDLAEEITQDVFLTVWRHADSWIGLGPVPAWLIGIARVRVRDHWSRVRRQPATLPFSSLRVRDGERPLDALDRLTSRGAACTTGHRSPDPAEVALEAELRRHVDAALDTLTVEQRRLIELVHTGELSVSAAARRLGWHRPTVEARLARTRRAARAACRSVMEVR